MSQTQLNSLMVLHVHKERTDKLNLYQANIFVSNKPEHRFNRIIWEDYFYSTVNFVYFFSYLLLYPNIKFFTFC